MRVFFDSSAFAKRYIEEAGSQEVQQILNDASELGLSVLCVPEIISALNRRRREQSLTEEMYQQVKAALAQDVGDATVLNLTPSVVARAIFLLEAGTLRTMDSLQVACAVEWEAELFVTADRRQVSAADKFGLGYRLL